MKHTIESVFQFPWTPEWETVVQTRLAEWAASIQEVCPRHGEPTEKWCAWEPHVDHSLPPRTGVVLLRCTFAPCPACRVARAGVPRHLLPCSFETFDANTAELRAHLAKCREFAADPHGLLLLLGKVGNGKSHLAASVLRAFGRGRYFRHLDLVNRLRATYGHRDLEDEEDGIADVCRNADLLVVDELGVAPGGNDAATLLYDILDHRVSNYGPTVLCANDDPDELEAQFGSRLADRFRHAAFAMLTFTAPSRRQAGNAAYLEQARAHARARRR